MKTLSIDLTETQKQILDEILRMEIAKVATMDMQYKSQYLSSVKSILTKLGATA